MLDVQTMMLVQVMITAVLTVILGIMALSLKGYRWLWFWFLENAVLTVAFLLFWKQTALPPFIGVLFPNVLSSIAIVFILAGVELQTGRKPRIFLYIIYPAFFALLAILTGIVRNLYGIRNLVLGILIGAMFWLIAHTLLTRLPHRHRSAQIATGIVAVLIGLAYIARIFVILFHPGGAVAWTREMNWTYTLVAMLLTSLGFGVGLIMMTTARVQLDLETNFDGLSKVRDDRDRLLSILSHDLRGSVGLIEQMLDVFVQRDAPSLPEGPAGKLRVMHHLARAQREMVTNILDWLRTQKEEMPPRFEMTDLSSIITQLLPMAEQDSAARGVGFECKVPAGLTVRTDSDMLTSVLRDLMRAGVMSTPPGGKVLFEAILEESALLFTVRGETLGIETADRGGGAAGDSSSRVIHGDEDIGIQICYDFAALLGGKLVLDGAPDGFSGSLRLPARFSLDQEGE